MVSSRRSRSRLMCTWVSGPRCRCGPSDRCSRSRRSSRSTSREDLRLAGRRRAPRVDLASPIGRSLAEVGTRPLSPPAGPASVPDGRRPSAETWSTRGSSQPQQPQRPALLAAVPGDRAHRADREAVVAAEHERHRRRPTPRRTPRRAPPGSRRSPRAGAGSRRPAAPSGPSVRSGHPRSVTVAPNVARRLLDAGDGYVGDGSEGQPRGPVAASWSLRNSAPPSSFVPRRVVGSLVGFLDHRAAGRLISCDRSRDLTRPTLNAAEPLVHKGKAIVTYL